MRECRYKPSGRRHSFLHKSQMSQRHVEISQLPVNATRARPGSDNSMKMASLISVCIGMASFISPLSVKARSAAARTRVDVTRVVSALGELGEDQVSGEMARCRFRRAVSCGRPDTGRAMLRPPAAVPIAGGRSGPWRGCRQADRNRVRRFWIIPQLAREGYASDVDRVPGGLLIWRFAWGWKGGDYYWDWPGLQECFLLLLLDCARGRRPGRNLQWP